MSKRIEKIRGAWSDNRLLNLPGVRNEAPEHIFRVVVDADPTQQKKMLAWILDAWENNGLLWEDIEQGAASKTASTLSDFERLKKYIVLADGTPDIAARSLMQYKNPGEMWEKIAPLVALQEEANETVSSRYRKKLDIAKAKLESFSATLPSGVTLTVPLSRFSSTMYGKGTRWCTAADKQNLFESYTSNGPLLIFTLPNGNKFQGFLKISDAFSENIFSEMLTLSDGDMSHNAVLSSMAFLNDSIVFLNAGDAPINEKEEKEITPYMSDIVGVMSEIIARSIERDGGELKHRKSEMVSFFSQVVKNYITYENTSVPPMTENKSEYMDDIRAYLSDIDLTERFSKTSLIPQENGALIGVGAADIRTVISKLENDILDHRIDGFRISLFNEAQNIVREKFIDVAQHVILDDEQIRDILADLNARKISPSTSDIFLAYVILNEKNIDRTLELEASRFRSGIDSPEHIVEAVKNNYIPDNIGPHIWNSRFGPNGWSHFCPSKSTSFELDDVFGFNRHFGHHYLYDAINKGASIDELVMEIFGEKRATIKDTLTQDVRHNIEIIVSAFSSVVGTISEAIYKTQKSQDGWGNAQNLGIPEVKRICHSLDPSMSETQVKIMLGNVMKKHLYQTSKGRLEGLRKMLGMPDNDEILARIISEIQNKSASIDGQEYFRYWLSRTEDFNYKKLEPEIRVGLETIAHLNGPQEYKSTARRGGVNDASYFEDIADILEIDYIPKMRCAELSASMAYPEPVVLDNLLSDNEGPETFSAIIATMANEKNLALDIMKIMSPQDNPHIWRQIESINPYVTLDNITNRYLKRPKKSLDACYDR